MVQNRQKNDKIWEDQEKTTLLEILVKCVEIGIIKNFKSKTEKFKSVLELIVERRKRLISHEININ